MAKTYDSKCWDLAVHFLSDVSGATDEDRADLATALQECAEDFIADQECCPLCAACPGFIGAECDGDCEHAEAQADV